MTDPSVEGRLPDVQCAKVSQIVVSKCYIQVNQKVCVGTQRVRE
jgi:hypothetical protein